MASPTGTPACVSAVAQARRSEGASTRLGGGGVAAKARTLWPSGEDAALPPAAGARAGSDKSSKLSSATETGLVQAGRDIRRPLAEIGARRTQPATTRSAAWYSPPAGTGEQGTI